MNNRLIEKRRDLIILGLDLLAVFCSVILAYLLRFDFIIPVDHIHSVFIAAAVAILIKIPIFYAFGLYKGMYRFTSLWDMINILKATILSSLLLIAIVGFLTFFKGIPRSIFLLDFILSSLMICGIRVAVRIYFSHYLIKTLTAKSRNDIIRLLLIGAGNTGDKIIRELQGRYFDQYKVVGLLDDNNGKVGGRLHGTPILANVDQIKDIKIPFDEILITAPSASGDKMRQIVNYCKSTGKRYRTVPGFSELINNEVSIETIRDVSLQDLLGRDEVSLDMNSMDKFLSGKRVLVSGAGGSIGSELVRQCLGFRPSMLILLDNNEQNLFNLEQEINETGTSINIKPILGDIRDKVIINKIFSENLPQVVLHAAAYKHVPIQELNPWYAILTNVQGTQNIVEFSNEYKVEKFILVSTDKAVHPVNIMGATKRLSERIIQSVDMTSKTQYMAVRFGNVIGSSGSVIPTLKRQIKKGGPITITHPDMTRYFMSIPESVQLILQTGAIGCGGEVFVLDMGKPIKIKDMAYDLIRLSGFEPETDIPVIYTGLRPGEKMYEELVTRDEKVKKTVHPKIMSMQNGATIQIWDDLKIDIEKLINITNTLNSNAIKQKLQEMMPEYEPLDYYPPVPNEAMNQELFEIEKSTITGQA